MGKKKGASRALTQEEIWDDSALVQSWDEAVEEYKLYHSIHAKGENIEDVLREAEAKEAAEANTQENHEDEQDDDMADAEVEPAPVVAPQISQMGGNQGERSEQPKGGGTAWAGPSGAPAMPNPILSQVQDEGLKNLMMAWYYAGYYTGLHEGQQRANQNNKST